VRDPLVRVRGAARSRQALTTGRLLQPNQGPGLAGPLQRWQVWVAVLLTGVAAGLGADLLIALLRAVQHASFDSSSGTFLAAVERSSSSRRVLVLALAGLIAGVGWYLLRRFSRGGGGDIAGVVWTRDGVVPRFPALANAVLSIVIVAMGASLGREAAPQQVGAVAAFQGSRWLNLTAAERRLLVACGAAAGMGAVYNVPLGAALFATEVLLGEITLATVVPALATTSLATAVAWIGLANQPLYTSPAFHVTGSQLAWAALAGPVFGAAADGWTRAIRWTTDHRSRGWRLLLAPLVVFTALGALAIPYPQLLGNGRNLVQLTFDSEQGLGLLAALLVLKPLVTIACLRSGASGGLFTPTMTAGALLGAALGRMWGHVWSSPSDGSYAIIGAGALLAGAMQGPLTAAALMVELVRQSEVLLVPLLIASVGATVVVRFLRGDSIYSARVVEHRG
jgi:CIC family chloride channel protein